MKLNCDLGEGFGAWQMGQQTQIMPLIDMANVACGFHAGDPVVMRSAIAMASQHKVMLGAHPSYPDLQGFGRRSMVMSDDEISALFHYQVAALEGMAKCQDYVVQYVKPHGALYNDMIAQPRVFDAVVQAAADYHTQLPLVVQATPAWQSHQQSAQALGVELWFEAFADRAYLDDGRLQPRGQAGAVLGAEAMIQQAEQIIRSQQITATSGKLLSLKVDTLCVHGDNAAALQGVEAIRALIGSSI